MKDIIKGSLYKNIVQNLECVAKKIHIDNNILIRLLKPKRAIIISIPVRMDDNHVKVFDGYRVQHNHTLGPCKGGIRFHPSVTLSDVAALAMLMSLKNALLCLPLGGAKGGVEVDPKRLSRAELQTLTRRYATELHQFMGPDKDIPAPDVGTNEQIMAWIMDTYSQREGFSVPGIVTGKPLEIGGSLGRISATGLGTIYCLRKLYQKMGLGCDGLKLAIHGFGNVGSYAALAAFERKMSVIAVSDEHGGIYNENGLNIPQLIEHYQKHKDLSSFPEVEVISNVELLKLKCDALLLAALDRVIHKGNAGDVQAKIVVEGANGPTTKEADIILNSKDIHIIPDILANGGGVIVSYFEWVQGIASYFWNIEEINSKLQFIITAAFDRTWEYAEKNKTSLREAALALALERFQKAMLQRGLFPR